MIREPAGRSIRTLPAAVGAAHRRLQAAEDRFNLATVELVTARRELEEAQRAWAALLPVMELAGKEAMAEARLREFRPPKEEE